MPFVSSHLECSLPTHAFQPGGVNGSTGAGERNKAKGREVWHVDRWPAVQPSLHNLGQFGESEGKTTTPPSIIYTLSALFTPPGMRELMTCMTAWVRWDLVVQVDDRCAAPRWTKYAPVAAVHEISGICYAHLKLTRRTSQYDNIEY